MAVMEAQRKQTERRLPQKRALRGPEKAAILFLCLGEQRGSALMQKLTDEEIQIMTRAMAGLGVIEADQVEQVMSDFVEGIATGGGAGHGDGSGGADQGLAAARISSRMSPVPPF